MDGLCAIFYHIRILKFMVDFPLQRILQTPDASEIGFIVQCDLHFPRELHDKLKELPPAPETLTGPWPLIEFLKTWCFYGNGDDICMFSSRDYANLHNEQDFRLFLQPYAETKYQ